MGFRKVKPVEIWENPDSPGDLIVKVKCPFCKKFHLHGGPDGDYSGHRSADCGLGRGYIVLQEGKQEEA